MAYASVADIQSEFKSITFGSSNAIGSATVLSWIAQEEAVLNAQIGTIYSTPVTATQAVLVMQSMSILVVKARIMDTTMVKTGDKKAEQGNPGDSLRKKVQDMITSILNKTLLLSDATLRDASVGVKSYNNDNNIEQIFKKDSRQW
jgi:hypothetical protein